MISVNAKEQVIYLHEKDGRLTGSVLVTGGKDLEGKDKPSAFMPINFSSEVKDKIYDSCAFDGADDGDVTIAIKCSFKGFLVHEEFNEVRREKLIVTDIKDIEKFEKEEKKEPVKRGRK